MKILNKILLLALIPFFLLQCTDANSPEETRLNGTWTLIFDDALPSLDTTFTFSGDTGSSSYGEDYVKYTGTCIIDGEPHTIVLHDNIVIDRIVGEISLDDGGSYDIIIMDQGYLNNAENAFSGKYVGHPLGDYAAYDTADYNATSP